MADFFTDSDDDKAVEEILSQAKDMIVLEQVAAINIAGLEDSVLPSHIERRFQKLKSLPSSTTQHASLPKESPKRSQSAKEQEKLSDLGTLENFKKSPELPRKCQSPSKSSDSGRSIFSPHKKNQKYPWDDLSSRSVSPPAKSGCFLCSPKNVSRKKSKENKRFDLDKNDAFLSDLSNFSSENRMKMMKRAIKEEEEICKEAEKIVRWAKQASARFDVSGIDEDDLGSGDDENIAKF